MPGKRKSKACRIAGATGHSASLPHSTQLGRGVRNDTRGNMGPRKQFHAEPGIYSESKADSPWRVLSGNQVI